MKINMILKGNFLLKENDYTLLRRICDDYFPDPMDPRWESHFENLAKVFSINLISEITSEIKKGDKLNIEITKL